VWFNVVKMSSYNGDPRILYGGDITIKYDHYASIGDQLLSDLREGGDRVASVSGTF
jgi:hypothetical protein